jgi:alpha-ribazole phosphatase
MRILHVIRHGEPTLTGVLLGRTDPPLSDAGLAACAALRIEADLFHSSPLLRARQSAEALARGRSVRVDADLAEIELGEWDGRSWAEIESAQPELAKAKLANWQGVVPPGGESWEVFTARVDRALGRVLAGPFPAAVVGHVAVNAWIAHRLSGSDPLTFVQPYAGVETYEL